MKQNRKQALTPKLRFPEFRDEPGWTTKRLGDAATLISERARNTECTPFTVSSGIGLVSQQERFGRTIAGNQLKNYFLLRKNDFAYNKSATKSFPEGFIARYRGDGPAAVPNSIFTCFRLDEHAINPGYLDHLFSSNLHGKWLKRFVMVGARAHGSLNVSDADLLALPVPLPSGTTSLVEQQRIADCLSSLDEVIVGQARKVEALKVYKKGLMQQFFPSDGKAVPDIRFPEFQDRSGWKAYPLYALFNDVLDFRGRTPQKLGMEWGNGSIISLSANNVKNGFIDYDAECYLGSEDLYQRWMGGVNLERGDLVFTMEAPLGNALLIPDSRKYILSQRVVAFKTKPFVDNHFLIQVVWGESFQRAIVDLATGSTAKGVSQKALQNVHVALPEKDEQQRIAEFFSVLDQAISSHVQQLQALKTHKAGLMQQLFPSPQEPEA